MGPLIMSDNEKKVALVTGASSGIGASTVKAFADEGTRVVAAARREKELDELIAEVEGSGGVASAVVTDVASEDQIERMITFALEKYGRLDYAVNNAGIEGEFASIMDLDAKAWDQVLNVNLRGCFLSLKHEAKAILGTAGNGAIVNVGSVNSFLGFPTGAAYVASKHALIGLTSSVSAELAPQGVRVNLVCPGVIDTPMHRRLRGIVGDELYDEGFFPSVHLGRAGEANEIAQTILFLCSEKASYITGSTITPDGGFTLTM